LLAYRQTDRQHEEHVGDHSNSNSSKQLCFPPVLNLSLIPSSSHSKASPKHTNKKQENQNRKDLVGTQASFGSKVNVPSLAEEEISIN
jgi:hypothetical protein